MEEGRESREIRADICIYAISLLISWLERKRGKNWQINAGRISAPFEKSSSLW